MRIRTQLLLSHLLPLGVVTAGFWLILERVAVRELSDTQTDIATRAVNEVATANCGAAQRVFTPYAETLVAFKAQAVANELSALLADRADLADYDKLRNDPEVRAVAIQDVVVGGRVGGYTCLVDRRGMSVVHPNREYVQGRNYVVYKDVYPELWELIQHSFVEPEVAGYFRFFDRTGSAARNKYLVMDWVPDTMFTLVAVVIIDDYFDPVKAEMQAAAAQQVGTVDAELRAASHAAGARVKRLSLAFAGALALLGTLAALAFSRAQAQPIVRLRDAVRLVGQGDFAAQVPVGGPAETADLARAFNEVGRQLAARVDQLKRETAHRQAMESELAIAREIQFSLLPRIFPPYPDRAEFSLHAVIRSAREVAGDFYDYFLADRDTLVVLVGDVSGKGVPAAFFMALARTLLRGALQQTRAPGPALRLANQVLAADNAAGMFVTIFLAVYRIADGMVDYANAGHHAAWAVAPDGAARAFGLLKDPALGMTPAWRYHTGQARLAPGETLLLFTDGVTEAHAPDGRELFGEAGLRRYLQAHPGLAPDCLCDGLANAVAAFQAGALFDDLTLLALQRNG